MSLSVKSLLTTFGVDDLVVLESAIFDEEPPISARMARILAWIGLGWLGSS